MSRLYCWESWICFTDGNQLLYLNSNLNPKHKCIHLMKFEINIINFKICNYIIIILPSLELAAWWGGRGGQLKTFWNTHKPLKTSQINPRITHHNPTTKKLQRYDHLNVSDTKKCCQQDHEAMCFYGIS